MKNVQYVFGFGVLLVVGIVTWLVTRSFGAVVLIAFPVTFLVGVGYQIGRQQAMDEKVGEKVGGGR
jgi:thiol:disulfide interchange protein